ncbi:MAG: hypothetical protein CSA21_05815 [Deltaproteobacteria bacterium]|nr:MAG: hypothetical protein CSA21_05815 [Deltaproteobacteria bacterium]
MVRVSRNKERVHSSMIWAVSLLCTVLLMVSAGNALAKPGKKSSTPKQVKELVIGDRVIDIAYHLGVMPKIISARMSVWPMGKRIKMAAKPLGCPKCITTSRKTAVADAINKWGLKRIIIEKNDSYCLFMPQVRPTDVIPLLKGTNVKIEYVDFSKGIDSAIRQTAQIFGKQDKADALIAKYHKDMAMTKQLMPAKPLNKRVVIIKGVYQPSSGKSLLSAEAPGMYSDRFMLKPLGCTNVGEVFNPGDAKPAKGHYMIKKSRKGFDLSPLIAADPDVIVAVGDVMSVQKALQGYAKKNPKLNNVKAIKDMAVYGLPGYIDASVIEYPLILRQWAIALAH